ncbi:hypothetical protein GCM10020000_82230 [Streptomyces olivoverticillatus]
MVAVHAIGAHPTRARRQYRIAHREAVHPFSDRKHLSGCLVTEPRPRQSGLVVVAARAEQHFRPVEAERVHTEQHLARTGLTEFHLLDPQHLRAADLVEHHLMGHHHCESISAVGHS